MVNWTPEMEQQLRALWDNEISASLIAAEMGVTKGAVIGKARRLGLPLRGSPIKPRPKVRKPRFKNVELQDLEHNECRFPTTKEKPYRFCGAKTRALQSYCDFHRGKVYRPDSAYGRRGKPTREEKQKWLNKPNSPRINT